MFVEHKEQGEAAPVKVGTLKLSEAIKKGCPFIEENHLYSGCALAAGYFSLTGRYLEVDGAPTMNYLSLAADAFGVPHRIAEEASHRHSNGESREDVADWLESQGC